ncbi:DNA-methyltransferase [Rhodococcus ruber]|uniref:DNA-methyltransferase n=1 Tax=Rhodococcus ruber TaxID=1830 RepID=UPI0039ED963A
MVTSPPYAMQRKSTYGGVPESDYPEWTVEWMRALKPALTERGSVMINISPHVKGGMLADYVLRMRLALRADGWFEHDELVWAKPDGTPHGRPEVPVRSWESCLWYSLTPRPWSDARRNGNVITRVNGFVYQGSASIKGWDHKQTGGVTPLKSVSRCKNFALIPKGEQRRGWHHPAPFPTRIADWLMRINTPDGGTVLDPFAGSGTTAVAAHSNGFRSVAIERDPEYVQMIVDRYKTVALA